MRTRIVNVLSLAIFLTLIMVSCSREKEQFVESKALHSEQKATTTENRFNDLFTFPIGTKLWVENEALNFVLPEGYVLILQSEDVSKRMGPSLSMRSGSVTCNCTEGSGCSPYTVGGQSGCSTDNSSCKKCSMSVGKTSLTGKSNAQGFAFIDAEIVNLNADMEFLIDEEAITTTKSPKGFIFEAPEVQQKISDFMSGFNNATDDAVLSKKSMGVDLPSKYRYTPVKFLGKLIFVPLNTETCISAGHAEVSISDRGHACSCSAGSGCTKGSTWTPKGTLRYCDAGSCTSCTLK